MSEKSKSLNVGIDIAKSSFVAEFMDDEGKRIAKGQGFDNNLLGAGELEEALLNLASRDGYQRCRVGLEATSFYDFHLAEYLAGSLRLQAVFGIEVYRINAQRIKNFKRSYPNMDKTDKKDAWIIADFLRFGRLPPPYAKKDAFWALQRITRYRFHVVGALTSEINYFAAHLFLGAPGFLQQEPVRPLSATGKMLLEEFASPDELANASLEELTVLITKAGKNHRLNPEEVAQRVQQAARESYRLRPELAKNVNFVLTMSLRSIRAYKAALKEIDEAVGDQSEAFVNPLITVPGLGPVYSTGLLAEIMPVERFPSDDALAKMAGLWWPRHQTSEFEAEERRLPRGCNRYLRYYLVEAANALRVHNAEYKLFYEKKYQEVTKHQHKRALVLTARKLVRLVYSLLKSNRNYSLEYEPPVRLPKEQKNTTAAATSPKELACG